MLCKFIGSLRVGEAHLQAFVRPSRARRARLEGSGRLLPPARQGTVCSRILRRTEQSTRQNGRPRARTGLGSATVRPAATGVPRRRLLPALAPLALCGAAIPAVVVPTFALRASTFVRGGWSSRALSAALGAIPRWRRGAPRRGSRILYAIVQINCGAERLVAKPGRRLTRVPCRAVKAGNAVAYLADVEA